MANAGGGVRHRGWWRHPNIHLASGRAIAEDGLAVSAIVPLAVTMSRRSTTDRDGETDDVCVIVRPTSGVSCAPGPRGR